MTTEDPRANTPIQGRWFARQAGRMEAQNNTLHCGVSVQRKPPYQKPPYWRVGRHDNGRQPACTKLMGRIQNPDMGSLRILHSAPILDHFNGRSGGVSRVACLGPSTPVVLYHQVAWYIRTRRRRSTTIWPNA